MSGVPGGEAVARFLDVLPGAPARVLLLDYDGTLAPFRVERAEATPYAGVREAVRALLDAGHTRVVVISGRTLEELAPLLGLDPAPELWGTHGWERTRPGTPPVVRPLPDAVRTALQRARALLSDPRLAGRLEVKPATLALHVRGMAPADARATLDDARQRWEGPAAEGGLELHVFDGGLELRAPGWNKGDAVRAVLEEEPAGAAVAYLGDDLTDEDAFRALGELQDAGRVRALGVLVRAEPRDTLADTWVRPPEELLAFLARWTEAAAG